MDRITGSTVDLGGGRRGFRNRNLGLGQAGTLVDAAWLNGVQEELLAVLAAAGLTPDVGNQAQLAQAIRRFGNGVRTTIGPGSVTLTADQSGLIFIGATAGNVTITMPPATAGGVVNPQRFQFLRWDGSGFTVSVVPNGSDLIEAQTSAVLIPQGASMLLVSAATNEWRIAAARGFGLLVPVQAAGLTNVPVPLWARLVRARLWGGGGSGGGAVNTANSIASGGGGGEYAEQWLPVVGMATLACTVGAGGASVAPGNNGLAGGTSSVATLLTAAGGGGGLTANGGIMTTSGAGGTNGAGWAFRISGQSGGSGYQTGGGYVQAVGGAAHAGSPSQVSVGATTTHGTPGTGPGGGGGGSTVGGNGGAGAAGAIILEFAP